MNDWILGLLVAEGIPLLALIYYLEHRRRMYMLEKGLMIVDSPERRVERRVCNGLFLMLAGAFVLLLPTLANIFRIEMMPTLEQVIAGFLIASAGLSLILGTILSQKTRTPTKHSGNCVPEDHAIPDTGRGQFGCEVASKLHQQQTAR